MSEDAAARLLGRYAWAIDDKDWDDLREVFTSDAVADYGAFVSHGVDELVTRMAELHHGLVTQHLIGSVLSEPAGDGAVMMRSHVRATLVRATDRARVQVAASYRDTVVATAAGPRIAERRVDGRWISGERSILPWFRDPRDDRPAGQGAGPPPPDPRHEGS